MADVAKGMHGDSLPFAPQEPQLTRPLLDGMAEGFALLDRDFRLLEINDEALRMETRPRSEMVGRTHWDLYPGSEDSEIGRCYKHAMAERMTVGFRHRYLWPTGASAWLDVRAFPTDPGLAVFYRDVTAEVEAKERLIVERERVQLALDAGAIVGTWIWDPPNNCFTADERFAEVCGLDPGMCRVGLPLEAVMVSVHPDDRARLEVAIAEALRKGGVFRCEYRVRHRNGAYAWVEACGRADLKPDGSAERFPGVLLDTASRRQAQTDRDRADELLAVFAETVPGVAYAKDAEGRMLLANRGVEQLVGKPRAEILGRTDLEFLENKTEAQAIRVADVRIMRTGEAEQIEEVVSYPDGRRAVWLSTKAPFRDPSTGEVLGLIGHSSDITARIEGEARLAEAEERLRLATEFAEVGFWDVDVINDVLIWPPLVKALFGISPNVPVSMADFYAGLHPDDREETAAQYAAAADPARRSVYDVEYRTIGKEDGLIRWVAAKGRGVFHGEECIRVVGTAIDITARKQAELALKDLNETLEQRIDAAIEAREEVEAALRQSQKMEAVGQLTGGIAHDFNNMLAVVIGSLDLAQRQTTEDDVRLRRYIDAAHDAARRAANLTQRLLAFSRQQPLRPETVDLNRLVANMSELVRGSMGGAIELETVLAAGLWRVNADPNQLENVILNLALNARDAMSGAGKLTIETQNARLDERYTGDHLGVPAGQYVLVAVTDTGSGMPEEVIAKAFDPFFTTKEVGKGTGLGLSQVYGFVKQSGGHVKIYSEPGNGTTVKVYLPRLIGPHDEAKEAVEVRDMPLGDMGEVVLIVEDETQMRRFSIEALTQLGYRVLEADSGKAALRLLEERTDIALLFTDVVMPEMNGVKLVEEARRSRPELKVLFTTGYTRNAVVHNGVLDPGVEMIGKPFSLNELAAKLREVLDGNLR